MHQELQRALTEKDERGFKVGTKRKWKGGVEVTKTKEGWKEEPTGREPARAKPEKPAAPPPKPAAKPPGGLAGRLKSAIGKAAKVGAGAAERAKEGAKRVATAAGAKAQAAATAVKAAPQATKKVASHVAAKIKGLPEEAKRLVTDRTHRAEVGKKMGEALKRKSTAAAKNIVGELRELKDGGVALKKLALRQKLDKHDKHALKESAKAIGMTIAGTIALGGIGHVTAAALSTHFAAETLAKHVGRAALFADIQRSGWPIYESDDAAIQEVVERVMAKVIQELEGLGSMSDEQIADILSKAHAEEGQTTAPEGKGEPEKKEPEAAKVGASPEGERDWSPGPHNRKVDTSKWGKS